MGHRDIKRVPLDFEWPVSMVWKGYVCPYSSRMKCKVCDGDGLNAAGKDVQQAFYAKKGFGLCESWYDDIDKNKHHCLFCKGQGEIVVDEAVDKLQEAWFESGEYHPPKGEGWQLWETCSEGSPVSPVFKTAEALAEWCETGATTFASYKATKEEWLKMFTEDSTGAGTMFVVKDGEMGAGHKMLKT